MAEQTADVQDAASPVAAEERPAAKPARRRAPRRDEVLAAAMLTARAGLAGLAEDEQIGEHCGATVDDDRLMTHHWEAKLPGYRGWRWYSTVARAPRSKHVTVCEVGLTAGDDAIVAPAWVPYADRVSEEERQRLRAVAEGRDPNRPAEGSPAPDAEAPEAGQAAEEPAQES